MKPSVKSIEAHSTAGPSLPSPPNETQAPAPADSAAPHAPILISDRQIVLLLIALSLAVYLRTVARDVLPGDAGEFHFAAWRLGLSHPTGYPLYLLLGHLWQNALAWIGVNPALALNAFSAVIGALTLGQLYVLMRRWLPDMGGLSQGAALFTATLFGVNLTYWSQNLIAEVYTLHVLFILAIFGVAYRLGAASGAASSAPTNLAGAANDALIFLSALIGLSLAHHGMTLLMIPPLVYYLFRNRPAIFRQPLTVWLGMILAGAAPLLLYLYIPLRSGPAASPWYHQRLGDTTLTLYAGGWDAFVHFVTGRSISVGFNTLGEAWFQIVFSVWIWRFHFGIAGLLLIAFGLFILIQRRNRAVLTLTVGYAATQQIFNLFYSIEDILVYYIPLYLMGAIWAGFGAHALVTAAWRAGAQVKRPPPADTASTKANPEANPEATPEANTEVSTNIGTEEGVAAQPHRDHAQRTPELGEDVEEKPQTRPDTVYYWSTRLGWIALMLLFFLPLSHLLANWALVDQSGSTGARQMWESVLAAEPPADAILVSNDRDEIVPLFYFQYVEERRQDLTGLFPLIAPDGRFTDIGTTLDTALAAGPQPVYLIKPMPELAVAFALAPATPPLVHVEGRISGAPAIPYEATLGPLRLQGYDWQPAETGAQVRIYWQPADSIPGDYTTTVQLFDTDGERIAQSDTPPGGEYYPTSLWKPGEQLIETHDLVFEDAVDPTATLLIGMYHADTLEHLAPALEISPILSE